MRHTIQSKLSSLSLAYFHDGRGVPVLNLCKLNKVACCPNVSVNIPLEIQFQQIQNMLSSKWKVDSSRLGQFLKDIGVTILVHVCTLLYQISKMRIFVFILYIIIMTRIMIIIYRIAWRLQRHGYQNRRVTKT